MKCKSWIPAGHCAWSAENTKCYATRATGTGKGHHGTRKEHGCEIADQDEMKCKSWIPAGHCAWSAENMKCYATRATGTGKGRHGTRKEHGCEIADQDETKCKSWVPAGHCAWSEERKSCYAVRGTEKDHGAKFERENYMRANKVASEVGSTVVLALRLNNVQFSLLSASPSVLSEFKSKVKRAIAREAGQQDVLPEHVSLDLKPGSVIVGASISTSGAIAVQVQQNLGPNGCAMVLSAVVAEVGKVSGIQAVTTGVVSASLVSMPVVVMPDAPCNEVPVPSEAIKLPFIIAFVAGSVGLFLCLFLAFFLCCTRRTGKAGVQTSKVDASNDNPIVLGVTIV